MGRRKTEQDKEWQRKFGQRVLSLREEQGLKQDDVMMMSGIERSFISNVENGIHSITSVRLQELAEGLRVDVTDLFEAEHGVARKDDVKSHPRYLQLADYMAKEIVSGLLRPGDSLEPEPVMCKQYGYSRFAVRKALTVLRGLGLIRTWGQNHFVASERDLQPLLLGDGDELVARMPTPEEAFHYGLAEGVPILICKRQKSDRGRSEDGEEIYQADRFRVTGHCGDPHRGQPCMKQ